MSVHRRFWWFPFSCLCCAIPSYSKAALRKRLAEKSAGRPVLVLDVRRPAEYEAGHIDGAINTPITEFRSKIPAVLELLDLLRKASAGKEPEVVCICLSAHRSVPAVRMLLQENVDACQLAYGMLSWRAGSYPENKTPVTLEEKKLQLQEEAKQWI
jgi:rhodanese-related sulfurtransferase